MTMTQEPKGVSYTHSLRDQGVLVNMQMKWPRWSKKDRAASREICANKGVSDNRARVTKDLIDPKSMQSVTSICNDLRDNTFDFYTTEWMGGLKLLMMPTYKEFMDEYNQKRAKAYAAFSDWKLNRYLPEIERARTNGLGELFDRGIYPTMAELDKRFEIKLSVMPIPDTDFRVKLGENMAEQARKDEQERMQKLVERPFTELLGSLKHFVERWDKKPNERFDRSAIDKVRRLVEVGPKLDMTGRLKGICDMIETSLPYMPEEMRDSEAATKMVCDQMDYAVVALEDEIDLLSSTLDT